MKPLWLLCLLLLVPSATPRDCSVDARPKLAIAPLAFIRVRVVIEREHQWQTATLTLYDDFSEVRRSTIFDGEDAAALAPRTTELEWRTLHLGEGQYELRLNVVGRRRVCNVVDRIEVH